MEASIWIFVEHPSSRIEVECMVVDKLRMTSWMCRGPVGRRVHRCLLSKDVNSVEACECQITCFVRTTSTSRLVWAFSFPANDKLGDLRHVAMIKSLLCCCCELAHGRRTPLGKGVATSIFSNIELLDLNDNFLQFRTTLLQACQHPRTARSLAKF